MLSRTMLHIKERKRKVFTGEKTALTIHRIGTVALEPYDFSHNLMYDLGWKKEDICNSTCWREALGIRVSSFGLYCEGFPDDQKREEKGRLYSLAMSAPDSRTV